MQILTVTTVTQQDFDEAITVLKERFPQDLVQVSEHHNGTKTITLKVLGKGFKTFPMILGTFNIHLEKPFSDKFDIFDLGQQKKLRFLFGDDAVAEILYEEILAPLGW